MAVIVLRRTDFVFLALALVFTGVIIGAVTAPERIIRGVEPLALGDAKSVEMIIPAVDARGNGVSGTLITTVRPGTGQVLVSINDVLAQFDTQISGRVAAAAAGRFAGIDMSTVDVIYTIEVNASAIEGPSAGASMAASIALALKGIEPDRSIAMTGTIREDGSVGSVGSVFEKAEAAKSAGAALFLVPPGQSSSSDTVREETCSEEESITKCRISYATKRTNIGDALNMTVEEVSTLREIMSFYSSGRATLQPSGA